MSGDLIQNLKMDTWSSTNPQDLLYTKRLLEPFDDTFSQGGLSGGMGLDRWGNGTLVERFDGGSPRARSLGSATRSGTATTGGSPRLFVFLSIWLVLFLTFPTVREKSGINQYILWLISAILLFGVVY